MLKEDIVDIAIGDSHRVAVKGIKRLYSPMYNGTIDFYHNHPLDASYVDYPLSDGDIRGLIRNHVKSVTAYNHLGEYSRVEITNPWRADQYRWEIFDEIDCHEVAASLGEEKGMRYNFLYNNMNKESSAELREEFNILRDEFQNKFKEWSDKNPQKYAQSAHRAYSAVLPKYGIKYTTNYSNLMNV